MIFPALWASYRWLLGILIGSSRCLLLLWLVGVIALVLVFRQSFENRSIFHCVAEVKKIPREWDSNIGHVIWRVVTFAIVLKMCVWLSQLPRSKSLKDSRYKGQQTRVQCDCHMFQQDMVHVFHLDNSNQPDRVQQMTCYNTDTYFLFRMRYSFLVLHWVDTFREHSRGQWGFLQSKGE